MASVPFQYDCSRSSGFVMDPNAHKRVGYVTTLGGFGSTQFQQDLTVALPFTPTSKTLQIQSGGRNLPSTVKVVGVIDKFSWAGGVGDVIEIDFWASQQNAVQLKSLQQSTLTTTKVNALAWWITGYDQETKQWFEQAYPQNGPVSGVITGKNNPQLDVDLRGVPAKDGLDVMVYKVSMKVSPAANQAYMLRFANSSSRSMTKTWGLVVGTLAAAGF